MPITRDDDKRMMTNSELWPGETLCLKKMRQPGTDPSEPRHGVITNTDRPVVIYLQPNFVKTVSYPDVDSALDDGWVVD